MSRWETVVWETVVGKMSFGKMSRWENVVWETAGESYSLWYSLSIKIIKHSIYTTI